MDILITKASENNLKNISVRIPLGKMTGITGVSGSGKSTLLRDIIAAYGARRFTNSSNKTIKDALVISEHIDVEDVQNLPHTMYIDVKSSVNNPMSTVSTVSGIHETLKHLFVDFGSLVCPTCGKEITADYSDEQIFEVNLEINELFLQAYTDIQTKGNIIAEYYYDKNFKETKSKKNRVFATLRFSIQKPNKNIIKNFNKQYRCRLQVCNPKTETVYDALREVECKNCGTILPTISRSRMSFNTQYAEGGGACRKCFGTGKQLKLDAQRLIIDENKGILNGALLFVSDKGIKYTTVTEKFIIAALDKLGKNKEVTLKELTENERHYLFWGSNEIIKFTDRVGGKKEIAFEGIANYLKQSYEQGKGEKQLSPLISEYECQHCNGTRIDSRINAFLYQGKSISSLLSLTIVQLHDFVLNIKEVTAAEDIYINRLQRKLKNYIKVSCGHLTLNRSSNTLSGGELQRIRICSLMNSSISHVCYLLDEPSSGLHYQDVINLGELLKEICEHGNSIIIVEHNAKLLEYCDYIVDMGPKGGREGGKILFQDNIYSLNEYSTATAELLTGRVSYAGFEIEKKQKCSFMSFSNIRKNNLKDVSVEVPIGCFTTVCGISGSGKSSFIKYIVEKVSSNPNRYGFDTVEYVGQNRVSTSSMSTVGSILKLNDYISKLYEKNSGIPKTYFMPNKVDGKCDICNGKGVILSETKENLGICEKCEGKGYNKETLSVILNELNIFDMFNTSFHDLQFKIEDKKIKQVSALADLLGVGYLSLSRATKSISKGELQRIMLIGVLLNKDSRRLIVLDEPSKGMHITDTYKLSKAIALVVDNENTVIAVEHNPSIIKSSDYMIEFGGTGVEGGHLLYCGEPSEIKDTPTAEMLNQKQVDLCNNNYMEEKKSLKQKCNFIYNNVNEKLMFSPYKVHYLNNESEKILEIAKHTMEDYLSVAIPNNIFFSKVKSENVQEDMPLMKVIDFREKSLVNVSIGKALGITNILSDLSYDKIGALGRYIFDDTSSTGKCKRCGGKGNIYDVEKEYFIKDRELTGECKKFLKNSTDFMEYKKQLKRYRNLNMDFKIDALTEEELNILWWGHTDSYDITGKKIKWDGIITSFFKYYKYYPDKLATNIYKNKKLRVCPVCEGNCLEEEYAEFKVLNMSYKQWYSSTVSELYKLLSDKHVLTKKQEKLRLILKSLVECKLGERTLTDSLNKLNSCEVGKIKIISELFNGTYDSGVVINNIQYLEEETQVWVKKNLEEIAKDRTVWVCSQKEE